MSRSRSIAKYGLLLVVVIMLIVAGVGWRLTQFGDEMTAPVVAHKSAQLDALASLDAEIDAYAEPFTPQVRPANLRDSGRNGVGLFIKNTYFRIVDGIGFKTPALSALLIPTRPPQPVTFDDPESFVLKPLEGTLIMPPDALSALFNDYLLDYPDAALRNIKVSTKPDTLIVDGEVSNIPGLWLPFHMRGPLALVNHHLLVYHPETVQVVGLPAGKLLDLIGVQLSSLLAIKTRGANIEKNAIVLDVNTCMPPPQLAVHLKAMSLDSQGLHLTFTSDISPNWPTPIVASHSYVMLQGGDIKTFRALLVGVRMQLVARDAGKLDTSLYGYRQQILGGYLDVTTDGGFVAHLAPLQIADAPPDHAAK